MCKIMYNSLQSRMSNEYLRCFDFEALCWLITKLIKFLSSKGTYRKLMYTDFLLILYRFLKMMILFGEVVWV